MKSIMVVFCSMVMLLSMASASMACDDMPLFNLYKIDGAGEWDTNEVYYNPKTDEFIFKPLGSSEYMVRKGDDTTLTSCDGEFMVRDGDLIFTPSTFKTEGFNFMIGMPFNKVKQMYVIDREIMDAIATTIGYGSGKDGIIDYYIKHIAVISIAH